MEFPLFLQKLPNGNLEVMMSNPEQGDKYIYIGGQSHPEWLGEVFTVDRVKGDDIFFLEHFTHTFRRDLDTSFLPESAVEVGKSYICCKKGHSQYGNTVKIRHYDGRVVKFEKPNGDIAGTIYIEKFHEFLLPEEFSMDIRPYSKEEVDQLLGVVKSIGFEYYELNYEANFLVFYHDKSFSRYASTRGRQLICISRLIDINPWIKNTGIDPKLDSCEVKFVGGAKSERGADNSDVWYWNLGTTTGNIEYYREVVQQGRSKLEVGDTVYSGKTCVENKNPCREIGLDFHPERGVREYFVPETKLTDISLASVPTDENSELVISKKSLLSKIWNNKLVQDWIG